MENKWFKGPGSAALEALVFAFGALTLVYLLRSMLITGETTLVHDNVAWNYPIFQFFAENIINGRFPFWNPFTHGGEPFYPLLGQIRLLEPSAILTIYIGRFATDDIVMLFNWNRFLQSLLMAFGAYSVLRLFARNLFSRLLLIPALLFSSFLLGSFRQDAILNQFFTVPFMAYFLLRIIYFKDGMWRNWLFLAAITGLNWQSYFFSGAWIFLLFFLACIAAFRMDLLKDLLKDKKTIIKLALSCLIIAAMAAPNAALMLEKDKYVFPARMIDPASGTNGPLQHEGGPELTKVPGINMPYDFIKHTGTFSTMSDFVQMISPDGNESLRWPGMAGWGRPSEAYIYLGLIAWAVGLVGIFAGEHDLKRVWGALLLLSGLLMLGPAGGLHRILYYSYPPTWFVRHTHAFVLFFEFAFLYFYVIGLNRLFSAWGGDVFKADGDKRMGGIFRSKKALLVVLSLLFILAVLPVKLFLLTRLAALAHFVDGYLYLFIAASFAFCWFLKKKFGSKSVFIVIAAANAAAVLAFSPNAAVFIKSIFLFLVIPVAVYLFFSGRRASMPYSAIIVLSVASVALTADIVGSFMKTGYFYNDTRHPGSALKVSTAPQAPRFPSGRAPFISSPEYLPYQAARYLSLVYREPDVLSSVKENLPHELYGNLPKLTMLEPAETRTFLSRPYYIHSDAGLRSLIENDGAQVSLQPPGRGPMIVNLLRTYEIEDLRNSFVWFSVWVKSESVKRESIQISIQDRDVYAGKNDDAVKTNSYGNGGGWERVTVGKHIGGDSRFLSLNAIVSSKGKPVYFKKPKLEITPVSLISRDLEFGLKNKRWSSFILPLKYYDLIHSGISPKAMEVIFAVGGPLIQFKSGAIPMEDALIPVYLKKFDDKGVKLLTEKIFIDGNAGLPGSAAGGDTGGTGNGKFTYAVSRYDYDSLDVKVESGRKGFLYWADGYDNGWRVYVNGKEAPLYRANVNFKAVAVGKGVSDVSFVYDPGLYKTALYVYYGAFAATAVAALLLVVRDAVFSGGKH